MTAESMLLPLEMIRTDGDTQPRHQLCPVTVREYAADLEAGRDLPPLVVFRDAGNYWLASGFHRLEAFRRLKRSYAACLVRVGTADDARWYAAGTNAAHGLRRTADDKRRAAHLALTSRHGGGLDDAALAAHCGIDAALVRAVRGDEAAADATPAAPPPDAGPPPCRPRAEADDGDRLLIEAKVINVVRKIQKYAKALGEDPLACFRRIRATQEAA